VQERAGRQEGGEREPMGRGEQGGRAGSSEASICSMIKGRKKAHNNWAQGGKNTRICELFLTEVFTRLGAGRERNVR
jgi:hypothetical protein